MTSTTLTWLATRDEIEAIRQPGTSMPPRAELPLADVLAAAEA